MKYLIFGGTGFIGSELVKRLKGMDVTVFSRSREGVVDGVKYVQWSFASEELAPHLVGDYAIINLVGEKVLGFRWTKKKKKKILESRSKAGRVLSDTIRLSDHPPKVFLQASGIGYYGTRSDEVLDESAVKGDDFLAYVCEEWESHMSNVPGRKVTLRIGLVLGSGGLLPLTLVPIKLFVGGPIAGGRQYMSWIHLSDLVAIMERALVDESMEGVYNCTAPNPVTNREFTKVAGKILRRPTFVSTPKFLFKIMLGEMSMLVTEGQRVIPRRLTESGFEFRYPDLEQALHDILGE